MSENDKPEKPIHKSDATFQDDAEGNHMAPDVTASKNSVYDDKVFVEDVAQAIGGIIAGMDDDAKEDPEGCFLASDVGKQVKTILYTWLDTIVHDEALDTQTTVAEILLSIATTQAQIDLETQGNAKQ